MIGGKEVNLAAEKANAMWDKQTFDDFVDKLIDGYCVAVLNLCL